MLTQTQRGEVASRRVAALELRLDASKLEGARLRADNEEQHARAEIQARRQAALERRLETSEAREVRLRAENAALRAQNARLQASARLKRRILPSQSPPRIFVQQRAASSEPWQPKARRVGLLQQQTVGDARQNKITTFLLPTKE